MNAPETLDLLVRQIRWESQHVVSLLLEQADGTSLPAWDPGAHIDLHLGSGLIRQYSLCGDPDDKTRYRVAVLREEAGHGGSRYVHESLRPGQSVPVAGPRNNFDLKDSPHYLFLAGGIGITPILAMVREAERRGADWELHYGGRSHESMAFLGELAEYGDRVHLVPQDTCGILDLGALLGEARPDTLVYACGPEGLLTAVEEQGTAWPDGAIQLERFKAAPREVGADAGDTEFRVVCEQSEVSVTVAPGMSIMESLEGVGIDVPNSCRDGICGSCETRVLCGTPDHRDSILSAAEQETGDTMMLCVSRSLSDELVLDI
ncbi:PDR/VanB family oxidoreductase [Tsukamurella sp. PLM1]|uniref:PDR/VanB family oxidoreductase n=1 Tax=Tsukamurella sp. PLM1 TaxID=2929795 RepID=UPI0020468DB7|nr:PDR/VanB family oxidoreductase [Tsukamurella sp. PLM1]BDH56756.1 putative oxidoreductase [Tsukamurella sp. PLM1]